jgi:hypothetical protein
MKNNKKKPRVFLVIDKGMIWEAYSDIEIQLLIKNVDKQWMRKLDVDIEPAKIDVEEELINSLESANVKLPGLSEEAKKHIKIKKPKGKFTRKNQSKVKG